LNRVTVSLPQTTYAVVVGSGILRQLPTHLKNAGVEDSVLVVSQPRIHKAIGRVLERRYPVLLIPDGERAKTLKTVAQVLDRMAELHLTRQSAVLAFGGGVVGDIAGFAASIYMRGVSVVQIPTTLLAQVDSSIGGKTGVNHRAGKNLIGTFHQPRLVLADPSLLQKLPDREYATGLYEALKYGVIRDATLFDDFENRLPAIRNRDRSVLERLVLRCAGIKAEIVSADEREAGPRRILNFGHTIGHGIEAASRYARVNHGEAVAYGMIAACRIAQRLERLLPTEAARIENAILSIGRLPPLGHLTVRQVLKALQHDKKIRDGRLHFVLPRRIGEAEVSGDVSIGLVEEVVREILNGVG